MTVEFKSKALKTWPRKVLVTKKNHDDFPAVLTD